MSTHTKPVTGAILMTYGSATTSEEVGTFLRHVYPNPSASLITEFARRFDVVGASPLVKITMAQAAATQETLAHTYPGRHFLVEAGMLHSEPFVQQAVTKLKNAGATRILGLLMSPQYSPHIMGGYDAALATAAAESGYDPSQVVMLPSWGTQPKFIKLLASRIRRTLLALKQQYDHSVPVIFTTHSLPERVVKKDASYLHQLTETTEAVVQAAGLPEGSWFSAYQSAGHTPEPWLKPDLVDVVADVAKQGAQAVLVVPIQFLADHLEILYDLDTAAREQTQKLGVTYYRLPVPNTDPLFIEALSDIIAAT